MYWIVEFMGSFHSLQTSCQAVERLQDLLLESLLSSQRDGRSSLIVKCKYFVLSAQWIRQLIQKKSVCPASLSIQASAVGESIGPLSLFYEHINSTGSCGTYVLFPFPVKSVHFLPPHYLIEYLCVLDYMVAVSSGSFAEGLCNIFGQPLEKAEVLNVFFASVFTRKTSFQESQVQEAW